ncbi:hypothetical protein BC835DRAFT_757612 [Cytidiella melzeri]|nr:hypothetical protein BC835DRAFT_757612 [Cytidiella melzeri]
MAATLYLTSTSDAQLSSLGLQDSYSHRLTDTDCKDDYHPPLCSPSRETPEPPGSPAAASERRPAPNATSDGGRASWIEYSTGREAGNIEAWVGEMTETPTEVPSGLPMDCRRDVIPQTETLSLMADGLTPHGRSPPFITLDDPSLPHNDGDNDGDDDGSPAQSPFPPSRAQPPHAGQGLQSPDMGQRASGLHRLRDTQYVSSSPRHPSLPAAGIGAGPSTSGNSTTPIVPMSAGPSYSPAAAAAAMAIPISSNPRAFAQQPTYINPSSANPAYAPPQASKEEVCVECAMRDQDMADVDVTSPGIWERESDVLYEDLLRREEMEEMSGYSPPNENSSRPRAKGGKLTAENLKMWLAVTPKEPSSRQQTLDQYVKAQRSLLEAEALAHSRAMRESRMIDDRMRDAYAQLRRSAYELGSAAQPVDEAMGVRIKAPRSISTSLVPTSREVTLLESGMIVEHVDVKKEEKERRREERRERSRVRKSSRSSRGADVMSVYSLNTPMHTDSGFFSGIRSESRYSQSIAQRPTSLMTGGNERPQTMLRAQSQASFSDLQSIGSTTSPRRSRFFGFKNLSTGFRSQDSLAASGSMIDMHLALQREEQYLKLANRDNDALDLGSNAPTLRLADGYPAPLPPEQFEEVQATKKRKGLLKFWKIVTGQLSKREASHSRRSQSRSMDRSLDDAPLAPPPPLSYLVNQGSKRHLSTPSLPSAISPATISPYGTSPPTVPSSTFPSPTSSPRSTGDVGERIYREASGTEQDGLGGFADTSIPPEYDSRGRKTQSSWTMPSTTSPSSPPTLILASPSSQSKPATLRRDKSLPPLPGESSVEFPYQLRPQTVFTYEPQPMPTDTLLPPDPAFRSAETRRQSFGGVASRPFGPSRTLPMKGATVRGLRTPPFLAPDKYSEFGVTGMALGQWPSAQLSANSLQVPNDKPKKRKSKFGLSSLFGKKSAEHSDSNIVDPLDHTFRTSQDTRYMSMYVNENGYASPLSTSSHTPTPAPRTSMFSKRNLEELVDQDSEFIAYRYPSSDQRLDLVR